MQAFGIDIGGSGAKGAIVDIDTGALISERFKVPTPTPATPENIAMSVVDIVKHHDWEGPIGCALPSVILGGVVQTAAHLDPEWIGADPVDVLQRHTGHRVHVLNDADAAGIAEVELGSGKGETGTVILLTFGTGIGSAIFRAGVLVPNTELGHLELDGMEAEIKAAARSRERLGMSLDQWLAEVNAYLSHIEAIFAPDLLIFGGGISKEAHQFIHRLETRARLVVTAFRNNAGIVGAALAGHQNLHA